MDLMQVSERASHGGLEESRPHASLWHADKSNFGMFLETADVCFETAVPLTSERVSVCPHDAARERLNGFS
jgi:hypothetical protein